MTAINKKTKKRMLKLNCLLYCCEPKMAFRDAGSFNSNQDVCVVGAQTLCFNRKFNLFQKLPTVKISNKISACKFPNVTYYITINNSIQ